MTEFLPGWAIGAAGLGLGALCGYFVQRARLCSFGAIEDALIGKDWRRMRIFALALLIAMACTQGLILAGLFDPQTPSYVPARVALLSAALGSFLFGIGMAFVGTCAFGSLVRCGTGDLRSLITMLVFGVTAYATLRGVLSPLRIDVLEKFAVPMPGGAASEWPAIVQTLAGADFRLPVAALFAALLALFVFSGTPLRKTPRLLTAGVVLGLAVAAGWWLTGVAADRFEHGIRVQSLTFVAPVARAIFAATGLHANWLDFGVMSVPGVIAGAYFAARRADEFRWEAYDDHYEMRRHISGGVLMGFGGVLAGGCTIGQGLTAGSLLTLTWPVTVIGMILGARTGIAIMMEGSLREFVSALFARPAR